MNSTFDSIDGPNPNPEGQTLGGFGYGVGLFLGFFIIFVILTYTSYVCKQVHSGVSNLNRNSLASTNAPITIVITIHNGLDEATLSSYPQFTYSQLKADKISYSNTSACSICLGDYKDADLLKQLPDCGHFFHLKCIDPWLILHPTCPFCRKSLLSTPLATTA